MSAPSGSAPRSASESPAPQSASASASASASTSSKATTLAGPSSSTAKPNNIFSNDGSFLQRFAKLKEDEKEKQKQEDALKRKRAYDERLKKRGRRAGTKDEELESGSAKKAKKDGEENAYMKEVAKFKERSLREEGSGVRPLVK